MGLPGSMRSRTSPPAARAAKHLSSLVTGGPVPRRTTGTLIRCIIVDDNHHFLRVVNDVLNHEGIAVVGLASTSAEALSLASRHLPDIVLVDVRLGAESGFDLAQRLMAAAPAWQPTVVLMSTYPEDGIRPMLEVSPAAAFIRKSAISGPAIREAHRRHRERAAFDGESSNGHTARPGRPCRNRRDLDRSPFNARNESRRETGRCRGSEERSG
jgi:DNA-binding NarL/FixJ family response regulator